MRKLIPDFRTIADFRKDNAKPLKQVFRQFTKLCLELDLFGKELLSIDGSKFRAVNAKKNNFTVEKLRERIEHIQQNINKFLKEMDENDTAEKEIKQDYTKEELKDKIKELTKRQQLYNSYMTDMKATGNTQKSLTDPEARLMMNNGKLDVCFNVQTAVDSKNHLIADFNVTNDCCDYGLLTDVAVNAKEELEVDGKIAVVADKGYRKNDDVLECLMKGIMPNLPPQDGQETYEFDIACEEAEITEEIRLSVKPEDIEKCIRAGVMPAVYKGNPNISITKKVITKQKRIKHREKVLAEEKPPVEVQYEKEVSRFVVHEEGYFIRDLESDTVTCPMGEILRRKSYNKNRDKTRYMNYAACRDCNNKCTKADKKTVDFKGNQTKLECKFYGKRINEIKTFKKVKKYMQKYKTVITYEMVEVPRKTIVEIVIKPDYAQLKKRTCLSEHPFGTVKHYNDSRYLLTKGSEKAAGELSLSFLVYNLKRAIKEIGVQGIISKMQTV